MILLHVIKSIFPEASLENSSAQWAIFFSIMHPNCVETLSHIDNLKTIVFCQVAVMIS